MSDSGTPRYRVGDIVGGHVLTESGWQPVSAAQESPQAREYRIGDQANGYVLTESGWQLVPVGEAADRPAPQYQIGDIAGSYVLTETGWQPVPGAQAGNAPQGVAPGHGAGYGTGGTPFGPTSPQPRSRKTLYWIVAGAATVLLILVVGVAAAVRAATSASTASSTLPSRRTSAVSPSATASPTPQTFAFGDTGTVASPIRATGELKIDAPVPFQPTNRLDTPDRGQLVFVSVSMAATGASSVDVDSLDFVAILPDGQRIMASLIMDVPSNAPARLPSSSLAPGEKILGSVVFDVPANTALKVAYAPIGHVEGTWG
ncbi:MAG: DUF4352 domain-containing protein [Dermatophilaceae bacterium]